MAKEADEQRKRPEQKNSISGFHDTLPAEMIARQEMVATIQAVYEKYGFVPLSTPAIERLSTLQGKYGEEADNLLYQAYNSNLGADEAKLALRYDLTVPLCRVMAEHAHLLPKPFKRYQYSPVWRGDRPQKGRFREFYQFDADVVGAQGALSDSEIIMMMVDAMSAFEVDALVRVNNRRILDGLVEVAGLDKENGIKLVTEIDKVDKIGIDKVVAFAEDNYGVKVGSLVRDYLAISGTADQRLDQIDELLGSSAATQEGLDNLRQVFANLTAAGYSADNVAFDPTIARGLSYYTGIIYETTLKDMPEIGSVCSGGRYDNLVADLGGPAMQAVGTSIGVDRLYTALKELGKIGGKETNTQVMITNFEEASAVHYVALAAELRRAGIQTEIYHKPERKLGKQLQFIGELAIPVALILGEDEIAAGEVTVQNMTNRQRERVPQAEVVEAVLRLLEAIQSAPPQSEDDEESE